MSAPTEVSGAGAPAVPSAMPARTATQASSAGDFASHIQGQHGLVNGALAVAQKAVPVVAQDKPVAVVKAGPADTQGNVLDQINPGACAGVVASPPGGNTVKKSGAQTKDSADDAAACPNGALKIDLANLTAPAPPTIPVTAPAIPAGSAVGKDVQCSADELTGPRLLATSKGSPPSVAQTTSATTGVGANAPSVTVATSILPGVAPMPTFSAQHETPDTIAPIAANTPVPATNQTPNPFPTGPLSLPVTVTGILKLPGAPPSEPAGREFSEAVGTRVSWLAEQRISHAEISLSPPDLGPIQIHLALDGQQVRADFYSVQADVRAALQDSIPYLREMLSGQGLQLLHVGIGSGNTNDSAKGNHAEQQRKNSTGGVMGITEMSNEQKSVVTENVWRTTAHNGLLDEYA